MLLTIEINQKLMPVDRGHTYEDPLDVALQAKGLGSVTGGGTQFAADREIDHIVVDATITGDVPEAVGIIMFVLEDLGAPKGSRILVPDLAEPIPFGTLEGLALYLNGTDLADEVYAASDTNALMDRFDAVLGDAGRVTHSWDGPARDRHLHAWEVVSSDAGGHCGDHCHHARLREVPDRPDRVIRAPSVPRRTG